MTDIERWDSMTNEDLCVEYQQTHNEALFNYFYERNKKLIQRVYNNHQIFSGKNEVNNVMVETMPEVCWKTMVIYNPKYGTKFGTILEYYVTSHKQRIARELFSISLPAHVWKDMKAWKEKFPDAIYGIVSLNRPMLSLHHNEENLEYMEVISEDEADEEAENKIVDSLFLEERNKRIKELLSKYCRPTEYRVIVLYFGLDGDKPMKAADIARKYHCTRANISAYIKKGLEKIKSHIEEEELV